MADSSSLFSIAFSFSPLPALSLSLSRTFSYTFQSVEHIEFFQLHTPCAFERRVGANKPIKGINICRKPGSAAARERAREFTECNVHLMQRVFFLFDIRVYYSPVFLLFYFYFHFILFTRAFIYFHLNSLYKEEE